MKLLLRFCLLALLAITLTSCLFKEPVFSEGFTKIDASLGGVWASENNDPRKTEFAVFAPIDDERYLLTHPADSKESFYYEARALSVRGMSLLQLRILAQFGEGLPKADTERFTLVWLEKSADGKAMRVRSLGGDGIKDKGPAEVKKLLEDPAVEWANLFTEPVTFRRLDN